MAPAAEASSSNSSHRVRKRKRGGQDAKDDKVEQAAYAQVNLEKLMKKLAEPEKSRVRRVSKDSQGAMMSGLGTRRSLSGAISPRTASSQGKADMHKKDKKSNTRKTLGHTERAMEPYILDNSAPTQRKERRRTQERLGQFATDQSKSARDRHVRSAAQLATPSVNTADSTKSSSAMTLHQEHASKQSKGILSRHISPVETVDASPAMTTLQCNMRKKLSGARFRWINEQLVGTQPVRWHVILTVSNALPSPYGSIQPLATAHTNLCKKTHQCSARYGMPLLLVFYASNVSVTSSTIPAFAPKHLHGPLNQFSYSSVHSWLLPSVRSLLI